MFQFHPSLKRVKRWSLLFSKYYLNPSYSKVGKQYRAVKYSCSCICENACGLDSLNGLVRLTRHLSLTCRHGLISSAVKLWTQKCLVSFNVHLSQAIIVLQLFCEKFCKYLTTSNYFWNKEAIAKMKELANVLDDFTI